MAIQLALQYSTVYNFLSVSYKLQIHALLCYNSADLSWCHMQAPYRDFDPEQARMVVILTYQRCGSSFFGQLFNTNPDVFYLYEPLDSLYSALYGTAEGWNVPSDITSFWNGSVRLVHFFYLACGQLFLSLSKKCMVLGK